MSNEQTDLAVQGEQPDSPIEILRKAGKFRIEDTGLWLADGLSIGEWALVGEYLAHARSSLNLCIGDWLAQGEMRWGETYAQYQHVIGYSIGHLHNLASVCRRFQFSQRCEDLTFSQYAALQSIRDDAQVAELVAWCKAA